RRDCAHVDLIAFDGEIDQSVNAGTTDGNLDRRPLRSANALDDFFGPPALCIFPGDRARRLARNWLAHARDDVVAPDTRAVRGRTLEQFRHRDLSVERKDADSDAGIAPGHLLPLPLVLLWFEKARMRIERPEHAVDGSVDEPGALHRLDILAFDRGKRARVHA